MRYLLILLAIILSHTGFSQKVIPANAGTVLQNRDVSTTIPSNGDIPKWNNTSQKWEPATDNTGSGGVATVSAGSGISISGTTDVTVNATDVSVTNEDLANNHQTLAAERNITNNGFDLKVIGSTNGTRFLSSGNVLLGPIANTIGYNNLHIINSGTPAATGVVGRGLTITANNATPPSIYFESPDLTDASQVMGVQFVSNSGLGLWKLASFNDAGSTATIDNIITATHAGNVGIGMISAGDKLDVTGTSRFTSTTTTGIGTSIVVNSLTTGTGLSVSSTSTGATSNTQTLAKFTLSGTNSTSAQTTYAGWYENTHTGTTSTNVGLRIQASGGTSFNHPLLTFGGNNGFAVTTASFTPVSTLHLNDATNTTVVGVRSTNGSSGVTSGDGFFVGIDPSAIPQGDIRNYEASAINISTSNTQRFSIAANAATLTGTGATTYTSTGTTSIGAASGSNIAITSIGAGDVNILGSGAGASVEISTNNNGDVALRTTGTGSLTNYLPNNSASSFHIIKNNLTLMRIGLESTALRNALLIGDGSIISEIEGPNVMPNNNTNDVGSWYKNTTTGGNVDGFATYLLAGATPTARIHQYENEDIEFYTNNTKRMVLENDGDLGLGVDNPAQKLDVTGNIQLNTAGNKLLIKEGTNASLGTAVLNGTTNVTINTTAVSANSRIFVTIQTVGGTPGVLYIGTRVAGTSFDIVSTSSSDTSTVAWWIVEPAP